MRRHWQWIVLVVGFFYLVIDFEALAAPVPSLIQGSRFSTQGLLALLAIHLIGVIWVSVQKNALDGGITASYVRTLPIPPAVEWRTVLYILLLSDSLFWVYLALPLVFHLKHMGSPMDAIALIGLLANVGMLLLVVQLYWLRGHWQALPLALLIDLGIGELGWRLSPGAAAGVAVVIAAGLSAVVLHPVESRHPKAWPWVEDFFDRLTAWQVAQGIGMPLLLVVQHRILFQENVLQTVLRMSAAGLTAAIAWAIVAFGGSTRLGYDLLVIAGCLSALLLSGLFRILDNAHAQVRPYLCTLPIRSVELTLRDVLYLGFMCGSVMVPLSLIFIDSGWATGMEAVFSSVMWLGLLALLQPLSTLTRHHTVVITSGATVGWIVLALLA